MNAHDTNKYKYLEKANERDIKEEDLVDEVLSNNEFWDPEAAFSLPLDSNQAFKNKLEEILKLKSTTIVSPAVQVYLKRALEGPEDKISDIGLLAFERKQFQQYLDKLRKAFIVKMREVRLDDRLKAKEFLEREFRDQYRKMEDEI